MQVLIFWLSYLWFPFAAYCVWKIAKGQAAIRWLAVGALILSLPLAWARFIEPRLLLVHHEQLTLASPDQDQTTLKIALFSDTHIGIFHNAMSMQRIIERVNQENVDAVFIAGDLLYWLEPEAILDALQPLTKSSAPVFAVRGNHDVGFPGPLYGASLYGALNNLGVTLVENRSFDVRLGETRIIIAGTSDLWERNYAFDFKADLPEGVPVLLLTHNPDMALQVPSDFHYDLMLAGHTHGGQIRLPIPGLTQRVIPTRYSFDTGLHIVPLGDQGDMAKVYVTPGTGMIGLPMRFRRPPRIDILTLTVPEVP